MKPPRLVAGRAILLVIDVQEKLVPTLWDGPRFLRRAGFAIRAATALEVPILATEQNPAGLGKTVPEIARLLEGSEILPKTCFSLLRSRDVQARLQTRRRDQVVLVGIETHVCVLQTALDALDTGLEAFVLMDAVTSAREEDRHWGQQRLVQAGVVPLTVQSFAYELLGDSYDQRFRALLPLLKEIAAADPE